MSIRTTLIASSLVAAAMASGTAHAVLQGRNMDGNAATFEAYYDTVLDITWLADANYAKTSGYDADGAMDWVTANTWAANLSFYNPLTNQTYADWRQPTAKPVNGLAFNYEFSAIGSSDIGYYITSPNSEMSYMFYVNLGNQGSIYGVNPNWVYNNCWLTSTDTCLDNTGPFLNLQHDSYWTDTETDPGWSDVFAFDQKVGVQTHTGEVNNNFTWAVHAGDIAAVPEAQTYVLMLAGLGLIGWRARRRG